MPARARDAVRLGMDEAVHRDWYHALIRGSWSALFGAVTAAFLGVNALFGTLYWLIPDQIVNARGTWADGFAFSVQTLFTIGYGYLAPQGPIAHALVTVESLVGLLMTAVTTGLVFARVSRPQAKVLFSQPIVLASMHGVPTLTFRVGNARGNEVLDASIRVVALVDDVSPEGHVMRRMHELTPVRGYSPIFRLSWSVMHRVDASSPLWGMLHGDEIDPRLVGIVCLLSGHDESYGGAIHAQHTYTVDDLRRDVRFVDVLIDLPDGRFAIDYRKFHETEPLTGAGAP